jgi:hypothetical protein
MMRNVKFYIGLIALIVAFYSCQKPIDIKATTTNINVLVVEGLINAGTDLTTIKLSRTVTIGNKTTANPEGGATITKRNSKGHLLFIAGCFKFRQNQTVPCAHQNR